MKRALIVIALLGLSVQALAKDEASSVPPTPQAASLLVEEALADKDASALKDLARLDDPDPWLVAHELIRRKNVDAAMTFAKVTKKHVTAKLRAYIETQKGIDINEQVEAAKATATKALAKRDGEGVFEAAKAVEGEPSSLSRTQVMHLKGVALQKMKRYKESVEAFEAAHREAEALGWLAGEASALHEAGRSAYFGKDAKQAVTLWSKQVGIESTRKNEAGMARGHYLLARAYMILQLTDNALAHYERASALYRSTNNLKLAAESDHTMASIYEQRNETQKAIPLYRASIKLFQRFGSKPHIGPALHNLGRALDHVGEYPEALQRYIESLTIFRELGNKKNVAHALSSVSTMHEKLGNYDDAIKTANESLTLCRELKDERGIGRALNDLGIVHEGAGQLADAIKYYSAAREIYSSLKDRFFVAQEVHNLGVVHDRRGDFKKAESCFIDAMKVFKELNDLRSLASCHTNFGLTLLAVGRIPEAISHQESALKLQQRLANKDGIARAVSNIGMTHNLLGNYKEAIVHYNKSLAIRRTIGDARGLSETLHNLGGIQEEFGHFEQALANLKEALILKTRIRDPESIAATLISLGNLRAKQGDPKGALKYYEQALEKFKAMRNNVHSALALSSMSRIHLDSGDTAKALAACTEARTLLGDSPAWDTQIDVAHGLAKVYLKKENYALALTHARIGMSLITELSAKLGSTEGARASSLHESLFGVGALAALRSNDAEGLFATLERGRASSLRTSIGSREQLEQAVVPEELRRSLADTRTRERKALEAFMGPRAS